MYCKKCGVQIADDSKFCSACGTEQTSSQEPRFVPEDTPLVEPIPSHQWRCHVCGNLINQTPCVVCAKGPQTPVKVKRGNDRSICCPTCGHFQSYSDYCHRCGQLFVVEKPVATEQFSMRYYNFLIYFSFYLGAIVNFINAILYMTGVNDWAQGEAFNIFYGFLSIGLGIVCIIIREKMANFKKDAILWFQIFRIATVSMGFIVNMVCMRAMVESVTPFYLVDQVMSTTLTTFLITDAILTGIIVAEIIYMRKRSELFVND